MSLPLFVVDAFTDRPFGGNPAAVVLLGEFRSDAALQAIAAQNNLSETAFVVRRGPAHWSIRWFTPTTEVPLCGHATLASAHVLFTHGDGTGDEIVFSTVHSGDLPVRRAGDGIAMDFPAMRATPAEDGLFGLSGLEGAAVYKSPAYIMAVLPKAAQVRDFRPDREAILKLDRGALIVTAAGNEPFDCVSRFFGPAIGVDEDPVTGAAHAMIAPYWSERLGRSTIRAFQASARGGKLTCQVVGDRVILTGRAALYMSGTIDGRCLDQVL